MTQCWETGLGQGIRDRTPPARQQSGPPATLWRFLPLGEPGLLLQGHNLAEPSRLRLVSPGRRPLTSSRMPRARSPGVLSWVIKRVEVKEHPFREPRGTAQTPLLPGDCGAPEAPGSTAGPADSWFDVRLGVGSIPGHPAQAPSGLGKITTVRNTWPHKARTPWPQTSRAPHAHISLNSMSEARSGQDTGKVV